MAFRPDRPFRLPNGRLVCGPHRRGVCDICCVDYDYLYEDEDEDQHDEVDVFHFEIIEPERVRGDLRRLGSRPSDPSPAGSGSRSVPSVFIGYNEFVPSSPRPDLPAYTSSVSRSAGSNSHDSNPSGPRINFTGRVIPKKSLFPRSSSHRNRQIALRCCFHFRVDDPHPMVPHTKLGSFGSTITAKRRTARVRGNGGADARAGCSFIYKNGSQEAAAGCVRFALENRGPTGERHQHTSNRAELRAVIAALRYLPWHEEGFNILVIATDSEYVARGATEWIQTWLRNGWKTSSGATVKNQDLWKCLFSEIEKYDGLGLRVKFWRIPREWNQVADHYAKSAVSEIPSEHYRDLSWEFEFLKARQV